MKLMGSGTSRSRARYVAFHLHACTHINSADKAVVVYVFSLACQLAVVYMQNDNLMTTVETKNFAYVFISVVN